MNASHSTQDREALLLHRLAGFLDSGRRVDGETVQRLIADFPEFEDELREYRQAELSLGEILGKGAEVTTDPTHTDTVRVEATMPQLDGYDFIREISRGGMGVVYEVRDRKLDRIVALKTIRPQTTSCTKKDEDRRFQSETQRVAKLDHSHIVPLYEAATQDGVQFFTMRFMSGGSLADRLRCDKLDFRQATQIVAEIALGVHHAHQRGLLHRDIKPGNILFDENGVAQIADFGLARPIDPSASLHSGAIVGTPMYMAPEQAKGLTLTTAADIFSLGAVLYELLTGRPPFQSESPLNTLLQLANEEPPRPRSLNSRIDVDLETICLKCLERDPERRYGSAEALADDLRRWHRTEPIAARRASTWDRIRKWAKRSPAMVAMTGAVLATLVVSGGLLVHSNVALEREQLKTKAALNSFKNATYFQSIALAEQAVASGDTAQAIRFLADCPVDLRHWEWNYLQSVCHSDVRHQEIASGEVSCIALDSTNERIIVGGTSNIERGAVWVCDASLMNAPKPLHRHNDAVTALAVSSSGGRLASSDRSDNLHIWRASDPTEVLIDSKTASTINALAFSPDELSLAVGESDHVVRVLNAETGDELWQGQHVGSVWSVDFNHDGTQLASASSDQTIRLWDARTGAPTRIISGHRGLVRSVVFSPDGRHLLSASYDGTARIWSVGTGEELAQLAGHRSYVTSANFSNDGQRIVTTSVDRSVAIWDATTFAQLSVLHGSEDVVWSAHFANNDRTLLSLGGEATLRLWKSASNGLSERIVRSRVIESMVISDETSQVAVHFEDDEAIEVWDTTTDRKLFDIPQPKQAAMWQFSSDGKSLGLTRHGRRVEVYDTSNGQLLAEYANHSSSLLAVGRTRIAFQVNENEIEICDIANVSDPMSIRVGGDVESLTFSPDDSLLAVRQKMKERKETLLFDVKSSSLIKSMPRSGRIVFSRDSSAMAVLDDSNKLIVSLTSDADAEDERTIAAGATIVAARFLDKYANQLGAVEVSERRVCISTMDGRVTIWDVETGRLVSTLARIEEQLDGFCLSGHMLVGYSKLGLVQRWYAEHGSAKE